MRGERAREHRLAQHSEPGESRGEAADQRHLAAVDRPHPDEFCPEAVRREERQHRAAQDPDQRRSPPHEEQPRSQREGEHHQVGPDGLALGQPAALDDLRREDAGSLRVDRDLAQGERAIPALRPDAEVAEVGAEVRRGARLQARSRHRAEGPEGLEGRPVEGALELVGVVVVAVSVGGDHVLRLPQVVLDEGRGGAEDRRAVRLPRVAVDGADAVREDVGSHDPLGAGGGEPREQALGTSEEVGAAAHARDQDQEQREPPRGEACGRPCRASRGGHRAPRRVLGGSGHVVSRLSEHAACQEALVYR